MATNVIKQRNWEIVNDFQGYRNREDITNLEPGIMVFPSHDVLTNLSDRIAPREGYTLFGQTYSNNLNSVVGSFDLLDIPTTITERHLKTWGTYIQVLYEGFDESASPVWNNLFTSSTSPYYNFTQFWEGDNQKLWTLGVNGGDTLWAWNNAMTGFLSATSTTLTKQGTTTFEEEGFDPPVNYTASIIFTAASTTNGVITDLNPVPSVAGTNYQKGDVVDIVGGGGTGGTAVVSSIAPQIIEMVVSSSAGFSPGDIVTGGTSGLSGVVSTVPTGTELTLINFSGIAWFSGETLTDQTSSATATLTNYFVLGSVTSVTLQNGGSGYVAGSNLVTSGGTGTGLLVQIFAVTDVVIQATMQDASNGFLAAGLQLGQTITISGTTSNNGTYTIAGITANLITIANGETFTSETDASTTITYAPSLLIDGIVYTYTGGLATTTLTGLSSPVLANVGDMIAQNPQVFPFSMFYGFALSTANVLTVDASQLYLGSATSNVGYISAIDNFFDYTFSLTGRLAGSGGQFNCDATFKALINLDGTILASTGKNEWNEVIFTPGQVTINNQVIQTQDITVAKIKNVTLQGAISQGAVTSVENNVVFLSFSQQSLILGKTQFQEGQQTSFYDNNVMTQLSSPVIYDFDQYNYTDATAFYDDGDKYIVHSFPQSNKVMIYNMNSDQAYWEAPQNLAIGRFAIIHGELYGHGYLTPETYKMFTGHNDNGGAISTYAAFSFQSFGYRVNLKHDMGHFLEGYIASNTTINFGWNFEQSGCGSQVNDSINGTDGQFVCLGSGHNWLGSGTGQSGKSGLGSVLLPLSGQDLPPAFQIISTLGTPIDFRLAQFFIGSNGVDQNWQMVSFGMEVIVSDKINVGITR